VQLSANTSDDGFLLRTYASSADPAAFAELVRRYADMVYATARRVTHDTSAAEDVTQDCFLRMAENSAAISGSLAGWLHRASLNRSLEMIRSERARRRREVDAAAAAAAASANGKADAAELVAKVDEGLAALPDELRAVVTEHFLLGRGQKEIATQLGLSQPTVSRRIERGLLQLRLWLAAEGVVLSAIAMPAMLVEVTRETAPATLPSTLAKIGLSGVRRPPIAPPVGPSTTILYTAAAAVFVAAISAWFALQPARVQPPPAAVSNSPAPAPATTASHVERGEREMKIPLAQVPEAARRMLIEQAQGATITEVDKQLDNGKTVYEIDVPIAGRSHEIRVAEDGTLLSKKSE
jgi:RNA polymerase sigma factor (sigma-70 family)